MHYLEDLIEYLEDLPEELQDRMEQIRKWDETVETMKSECTEMEHRLFSDDPALTVEQKQSIALDIAEKFGKMRSISYKKEALAERCCILFEKLYKKASESVEAFQMELTVDNPGVAEQIQEKFKQDIERRKIEAQYAIERRIIFESDESERSTPDVFVPMIKSEGRSILKERNTKNGKGSILVGKGIPGEIRKKPGRRPGKDGVMSNYMRKKQERLREQQKLLEIHARREEERKRKETNSHMSPIDITAFCAQACGTVTPIKQPESDIKDHSYEEDDEGLNLFSDLADMLGPDDQIRDDVDLGAGCFNLLSTLGREDLEIVESVNDGSLFTTDEETISGLGAASSSQSPMYISPSSFDGCSVLSRSPSKQMPSSSSFNDNFGDERKKKKITFSCTSDTSIHGRPRKLTDRAAQMVQQNEKKASKKHKEVEEESAIYCYCRQGSFGTMVACEMLEKGCPYQWFHLDCVGLSEAPKGKWYCKRCRATRNMMKDEAFEEEEMESEDESEIDEEMEED